MKESDSWQNAKQFSILGMPIILDEPLLKNNRDMPSESKRAILTLEENVLLDKQNLAIKELDAVNIKTNISKLDRFENWMRVDGELEFEINYIPKESGMIDEDLNIDDFLKRLNLDNENIDPIKLDWERFFDNEDLEDEDEISDEFEDDDFDDNEEDELEFRGDGNLDKKQIVREKKFSVIIDLGDTNIEEKAIAGLARVEFSRANLLGSKEIKLDLVIGLELNNNIREVQGEETWFETPLLTQGNYSLTRSGIKINEIVAYQLEPEISDISISDGNVNINGFFNMQIAFYHEENNRNLSLLNLRKPIYLNNIIDSKNYNINTHKMFINSSNLYINNDDNLTYEADVSLWLQEKQQEEEVYENEINDLDNVELDIGSSEIQTEIQAEMQTEIQTDGYQIDLQDENVSFDDLLEEYESRDCQNSVFKDEVLDTQNVNLDLDILGEPDLEDLIEIEDVNATEDIYAREDINLTEDINITEDMNINDEMVIIDAINIDEELDNIEELKDVLSENEFDELPEHSDFDIEFMDELNATDLKFDEITVLDAINKNLELNETDDSNNDRIAIDSLDTETLDIETVDTEIEDIFEDNVSETFEDISDNVIRFDEEISNVKEEEVQLALSDTDEINEIDLNQKKSLNYEVVEEIPNEEIKDKLNIKIGEHDLSYISGLKGDLKTAVKKISKKKDISTSPVSQKAYTMSLYLIKEGDTLNSIAEKYSISPEELQKDNKITLEDIYPNNSIFIKKRQ